ncbi:MAG: cell wall hydrolase [Geminicoccaceae bacterium]
MIAGEARTILEALLMIFAVENGDPASFERQTECMAQNIWFETRGSAFAEKLAVAQVVLNRVEAPDHADTPCEVIWEDRQFSWTHDGLSDRIRIDNAIDRRAWTDSVLAALVATASKTPDLTGGSTHFHAVSISPGWSRKMDHVVTYGDHDYYVEKARTKPELIEKPRHAPLPRMAKDAREEVSASEALGHFWDTLGLLGTPGEARPAPRVRDLVPVPGN